MKLKVIISLFETVRLSVLISPRNLYNSLKSIKEKVLSFQTSQKSRSVLQDGSRSLGLFRKGKASITAIFQWTDLVICSHFEERKTLSHIKINTVNFHYHEFKILQLQVDNEILCAVEEPHLLLKRFLPSVGIKPGTTRSADQLLIH